MVSTDRWWNPSSDVRSFVPSSVPSVFPSASGTCIHFCLPTQQRMHYSAEYRRYQVKGMYEIDIRHSCGRFRSWRVPSFHLHFRPATDRTYAHCRPHRSDRWPSSRPSGQRPTELFRPAFCPSVTSPRRPDRRTHARTDAREDEMTESQLPTVSMLAGPRGPDARRLRASPHVATLASPPGRQARARPVHSIYTNEQRDGITPTTN